MRPEIKRSIIISFAKDHGDHSVLNWIRVHKLTPDKTAEETWNTRYKRWMEYWRAGGGRIYFGSDVIPFDDPHLREWIEVWKKQGQVKVFAYKDATSNPADYSSCSDLIDIFTYWITEDSVRKNRENINSALINW